MRRVPPFFPDQLISRGRGETGYREELFCAQPIVLVYRAQHLTPDHAVPRHHVFIPPGMVISGMSGPRPRRGVARAPGNWARAGRARLLVAFGRDAIGPSQPNVPIQPAMARPISSGESS